MGTTVLLAALLAPAADPPGPELVLHPSARTGRPDLFLTDPVKGDTKNLTNTPDADELGPAFSPNGRRVAYLCKATGHDFEVFTCDSDGTNRKQLTKPGAEPSACFFPSWSPDGKRLAYTRLRPGGDKCELHVMTVDGATDDVIREGAVGAAWGPDGRIAFVRRDAAKKQSLCLCDADGENVTVLIPEIGKVELPAPAWSPDGRVVACPVETPYGWQIALAPADGGPVRQLTTLPGMNMDPVWVAPDRLMFAHTTAPTARGYGVVKADGTRLDLHPMTKAEPPSPLCRPAVYVPRPEKSEANPVRPVAHAEPAPAKTTPQLHPVFFVPGSVPGSAASVAWSADGKQVAVGLQVGPVAVGSFDGKRFQPTAPLLGHGGSVTGVVFTPDGTGVISAAGDKTIRTWDIAKKGTTAIESDVTAECEAVAASADGKWLVTGHRDGTLKVRELGGAARTIVACEPKRGGAFAVAVTADGKRAFAGCGRWELPALYGCVAAFDPATGKEVWRSKGCGGVMALAVSPDGKKVAGACLDSFVRVWDAATGAELAAWKGHTDRCTGVTWARGGAVVVSSGFDHTVRVWDAATGANVQTLAAHVGPALRVAASPDGRYVASTGAAGAVFFWRLGDE